MALYMAKVHIQTAREKKEETVKTLGEKIAKSKTIAFTAYHGLTVNQVGELRFKIKDAGGEMIVAKNSLMSRALSAADRPTTTDELAGPTATIFAYEDEIAPIKAVADNIKTSGLPSFKFGFFGYSRLDTTGLENLAKIPTRDALHGQVVGLLVSPIRGIVNVLNANLRNLAIVLDQIAKQKS